MLWAKQVTPKFLVDASLGILGAATASNSEMQIPQPLTPGAPPHLVLHQHWPQVSVTTFAEAEKLVQVEMTAHDRAEAASNWRTRWHHFTNVAQGRSGCTTRWSCAVLDMESRVAGPCSSIRTEPVCSQQCQCKEVARERRSDCFCFSVAIVALD